MSCLLVAWAGAAIAADSAVPDTVYVMRPIVVEASRWHPSERLLAGSGFVAVLETRDRAGRVEDLSQVLSQLVGVRVNQYGGLGSFATVSVRGSSSSQVRVFLDGVPVDDTYLGVTDISRLPLGGVERIEVYRGFSPPALGASAIGGAINLVTAKGVAGESAWVSRAEAYESYGSFDTATHRTSLWSNPRHARVFAHAGYSHSRGDFKFNDDNGTPASDHDDAVVARANNDYASWDALVRAQAHVVGVGEVTIGHDASAIERGVPGLGSFQSLDARSQRRRRMSYLRVAPSRWSPRVRLSAQAFYSQSTDEYNDPAASIALAPTRSQSEIRSYGGRAHARWFTPVFPIAFETVLESRKDQYHPTRFLPTVATGPDRWRGSHTASLSGEVFLFDEALVFSGTERVEWQSNEFFDESDLIGVPPTPRGRFAERNRSPSAGVRWHVDSHVTLKANVGRYYRLPTFLEMFGNIGAVTGNAGLRPERGVNRDIGVVVSFDRMGPVDGALLEAVYLHNDVDDLILFFPNSQRTARPVNIGAAAIRGVEVSASAAWQRATRLALRYSYLDTEDTGGVPYYAGNELPSRPRHDFSVNVSHTTGPWRLTYEHHSIGANFLDRANLQKAPTRRLHNIIVNLNIPATRISLTFEGRNLSDDPVSDVNGFPLPGRSFYSTIGYRYHRLEG